MSKAEKVLLFADLDLKMVLLANRLENLGGGWFQKNYLNNSLRLKTFEGIEVASQYRCL